MEINMEEKSLKEIIREKYKDLFEFADEITKRYDNFLVGKKDDLIKGITAFHFTRAIHLLESIKILCRERYATESLAILRSLFNLYINIKWLNLTNEWERYADFEYLYKRNLVDVLKKHKQMEGDKEKDKDLNEKCNKVINKYELNIKNYRNLSEWSGKSIRKMAEDVQEQWEYDIIYQHLSSIEHTSPSSVKSYLNKSESGATIIKHGPKEENIFLALFTAISYFIEVKEITYKIFDSVSKNCDEEINELNNLKNKYDKVR